MVRFYLDIFILNYLDNGVIVPFINFIFLSLTLTATVFADRFVPLVLVFVAGISLLHRITFRSILSGSSFVSLSISLIDYISFTVCYTVRQKSNLLKLFRYHFRCTIGFSHWHRNAAFTISRCSLNYGSVLSLFYIYIFYVFSRSCRYGYVGRFGAI